MRSRLLGERDRQAFKGIEARKRGSLADLHLTAAT